MIARNSVALLLLVLAAAACSDAPRDTFQGYAEGEYVFVASPYAGALEKLPVARGTRVEAGATVFVLEHEAEQAAVAAAEARVRGAEATIANLTAGQRKPQLDALRAQIDSAAAALKLAKVQLERDTRLAAQGYLSSEALDVARASYERDAAQLAQMEAQLRSGLQSLGRQPEIDAARAQFEAARADLAQARVRLEQKTGVAPAAALVQDTFFREGEWVPAGTPVASLLPPGNVKVRFYVPQAVAGSLKPGQAATVTCDGCPGPIAMRVSYISPQVEYTPPVIYSRESRAKLVMLVEARPEGAAPAALNPGQPVEVKVTAP